MNRISDDQCKQGMKKFKAQEFNLSLDILFKMVAEDNVKAFEIVFKLCYKPMCNFADGYLNCYELAEEIVDDVFFNIWKNRKKIQVTTSFKNYLMTSVRNRSLDGIRSLKRKKHISLDTLSFDIQDEETPIDKITFEELNCSVNQAIDSLPPQCKAIFLLIHDEELSYRSVSNNLGVSVKTVDTQIYRARLRLRKALHYDR